MSKRFFWVPLLVVLITTPLTSTKSEAQTVASLTLAGTNFPTPYDVSANTNPIGPNGAGEDKRFHFGLVGTEQVPSGATIQEVRYVGVSSGTFTPGVVPAGMRPLIGTAQNFFMVVNGAVGPAGTPPGSDLLEIYGNNQYGAGGNAVFTTNPFTGQPWTKSDIDTLQVGFLVRWRNTGTTSAIPQQFSMNGFRVEVVYSGLTLTVAPAELALSTGDNGRYLTTTADPITASIAPTYSVGTSTNPNSSCSATLTFAPSSGVGTVNSVVTAAPAGCSTIADNVRANVGTNQSLNASKLIVPPQIMIKMVVGEAGGQPGNIDQQAILVSARNRFGDSAFPGGKTATWQAVITPAQYYGANDPTTNGPQQELDNASAVFTGQVSDIVGGSKCYWSPTTAQWLVVQQAIQSGTTTFPANTGTPACFAANKRQIVYKASIGLNVSGGPNYQNAPAFVFIRTRQSNQPAAVQIP